MFDSLEVPLIGAPMAGGPSTPGLVAAVNTAGGLGFLAAGYKTPEAMSEQIAATKQLTDKAFGVNLFTPQRQRSSELAGDIADYAELLAPLAAQLGIEPGQPIFNDDHFDAKIDALVANPVAVVTFTFGGVPSDVVRRLQRAGSHIGFTITSADEARRAEDLGADFLVAQGVTAGGHRGTWSVSEEPNASTTDMVVRSARKTSDLPVIGAGGVGDRDTFKRLLDEGCAAISVGTLLVTATESGASPTYKRALLSGAYTAAQVTRAFSGRYARGLVNGFIQRYDDEAPAAYPDVHYLTAPIRAAGAKRDDPELLALWAGSAAALVSDRPAAEIIADLL